MPQSLSPVGATWLMNCANWNDRDLYMSMKWSFRRGHMENRLFRKCTGIVATHGVLELLRCRAASAQLYSQWTRQSNGAITNGGGGCLDVGAPAAAGQPMPLVLRPCLPGAPTGTAQEWTLMSNGFLRSAYHGLCVGLGELMGHPGIKHALHLTICPVTTQLWQILPSGLIMNSITGKCLDTMRNVTGGSWWDITSWDCDENRKHQQWVKVS